MKKRRIWVALSMIVTVLSAAAVAGAQTPACKLGDVSVPSLVTRSLGAEQFRALHAAVAPRGAAERWTEIPWEVDLTAARQRAAREKKPLVLWFMDGHPLGCT
jgi:hypothetical protein